MPCERSGQGAAIQIDLARSLPWIIRRRAPKPGSEHERLVRAQADKLELDIGKRRGELLLASDVEQQDMALAADFRSRLDGLPGRIANELAGITDAAEIRRLLLEETRAIATAFADAIRKQAQPGEESIDDGGGNVAASDEDSEPVG